MLSAQLRPTWKVHVPREPKFPLGAKSGKSENCGLRATMIHYRDGLDGQPLRPLLCLAGVIGDVCPSAGRERGAPHVAGAGPGDV